MEPPFIVLREESQKWIKKLNEENIYRQYVVDYFFADNIAVAQNYKWTYNEIQIYRKIF